METEKRARCPENEELAMYMWSKREQRVGGGEPNGARTTMDKTLYKAYCSVCNTKTPIKTLKEFSEVKGVGKWTVRLMQGFFKKDTEVSQADQVSPKEKTKKSKGARRYVPQKHSVPYALLITLYRGTSNGIDFMRKQELIDAAEASGLSRVPIAPELGKGKQGQFGVSSKREWYSGWSSMKTLIEKGLVVRSSCPAKYMLTQEGREAACDCLSRSGEADCNINVNTSKVFHSTDEQNASDSEIDCIFSGQMTVQSVNLSSQEKSVDAPIEFLEKFSSMGYSTEQIHAAFAKVSQDTQSKDLPSLLPAVIRYLQKHQVDVLLSVCRQSTQNSYHATPDTSNVMNAGGAGSRIEENVRFSPGDASICPDSLSSHGSGNSSFTLQPCSTSEYAVHKSPIQDTLHANIMVPPLRAGQKFEDVYDVILILDDRENHINNNKGCRSRKLVENIRMEFKIQVEVRRLPVGDALWIARHKQLEDEYVLDFIVERKEVDDLRSSIRDSRYRDQKLRLLRCGLQKVIYLVEGDPNASEAAESIKTACFTTEILEGFDVQRTSGLGDTFRKYGFLTLAIYRHYSMLLSNPNDGKRGTCPSFDDFLNKCQDLEKMTVSDVFGIQLMQVPQVTEEIALTVLSLYPTVISLARAYTLLEGDVRTQEEMLMMQSNNMISRGASKNIFKFVWGA